MKEHVCVDCKALPTIGEFNAGDYPDMTELRPPSPRPAPHGGPRSRRCATHHRAHRKAQPRSASGRRSPRKCTSIGCPGCHVARGLCGKHYQRWLARKNGVELRSSTANDAAPIAGPGGSICEHCGELIEGRRRKYHPGCLPAVKAAAQAAKRRCGRCRKTRAASKFTNDASRPDGKFPWCVSCQAAGFASGRFQSPDDEPNGHICPMCDTPVRGHKNRRFCSAKCKDRVSALSKRFGLTVLQYRSMTDATGGFCPLCKCRPRMWAVDHNHKTGFVTGVVCTGCNIGLLAASRHDLTRVEALVSYLTRTPAEALGISAQVPEGYKSGPSNIHKIWKHGVAS